MHVGGLVGEADYERRVFGVVPGGFKGHPAKNGGCVHSWRLNLTALDWCCVELHAVVPCMNDRVLRFTKDCVGTLTWELCCVTVGSGTVYI